MRRTLAVLLRDYGSVAHNVIALLICLGLAVMPSLYAWFNIAGGWDPYGSTDQVRVAVASADEGYTGSLVPVSINVGDRVLVSLAQSKKIDYVVTSEEEAIEGVRSGAYYAAVVMPRSFSADLLSAFSKSATHPQIDYYVNEKRNAIASVVTGKASGSVQAQVDEGFAEALAQAGADLLDELSGTMDDEALMGVATGLAGVLDGSAASARRVADDLGAYEDTIRSMRELVDSTAGMLDDNAPAVEAGSMLDAASEAALRFDNAARDASSGARSALDGGIAATDGLGASIDAAFDVADGQATRIADALGRLEAEARSRRDALQRVCDGLDELDGVVYSLQSGVESAGPLAELDISYAHEVRNDLGDVRRRAQAALAYADDLLASYVRLEDDLRATRTDAQTARAELKDRAAKAREGLESLQAGLEGSLAGGMDRLGDTLGSAGAQAADVSRAVRNVSADLKPLTAQASDDVASLEESLGKAAGELGAVADSLEGLHARLAGATSSGDMDRVRAMVGSDPAGLADFLSTPVATERVAVFPVENNGSAMAPYYTTMALWVGGTLMGVLFYTGVSEEARRQTGARPRHAYFGRLLFFLTVGACQSTILLLGDLFFLGIQCQEPLLFMLTGWLASTVFINIIFALATSFGDVGKAVAVLLMVVQVAGSGGTFPVQMLPAPFQRVYPFLPFVHSENAMRAAMFGTYSGDWLASMRTLAAYLVPALTLGLVVRKPLVGLNEWIEAKLEETKIM